MCRNLLITQNKPFNAQGVTDCLAQYGVRKAQAQRVLDELVTAADGIVCKEFGKVKIYFASQADTDTASPQEMEEKQKMQAELNQQNSDTAESVKRLKAELSTLKGSLSLDQIEQRIATLQTEVQTDEAKLSNLQGGKELISEVDRQKAEQLFSTNLEHWRRRRRIFLDIWDIVSENIDRRKAELFEELGIEAEDSDLLAEHTKLKPNSNKRRCC